MSEQPVRHSHFDLPAVQAVMRRTAAFGVETADARSITDYESFARAVPVMGRGTYATLADAAFRAARGDHFYVGASSGTSGPPRLVLARQGRRRDAPASAADRDLVQRLRHAQAFRAGDVVANLFPVDQFCVLHHGACRLLEACEADIVPVGRLETGAGARKQLEFLARLKTNVLFGTPSSLVHAARLLAAASIALPVTQILFTGENLGLGKRRHLQSVFGNEVRIFGLYGLAECGFVAIAGDVGDGYAIRHQSHFVECVDDGEILVTALDEICPVPVLRYATGDKAVLAQDGDVWILRHIERTGVEFKFMGNFVSYQAIKDIVVRALGRDDFTLQLELATDTGGRDILDIRILRADAASETPGRILAAFRDEPALRSAILAGGPGQLRVNVEPLTSAVLTAQQKEALVIDHRRPALGADGA